VLKAVEKLARAPIFIDDSSDIGILEVRAKARRLHARHDLGLLIVDYLQLMRPDGRADSRVEQIGQISRGLKILARELDIPVIAVSQLSRAVESRNPPIPMLSDLRECVTGDTLVTLADGRRVPIEELVGTTPTVLAVDDHDRIVPGRSDKVWRVGRRPVLRLRLASGRVLRGTAEHRVRAGTGWRKLGDLAAGERVAVGRSLPKPSNPIRWPEDQVRLVSDLIGDGGNPSNQPPGHTTACEESSRAVRLAGEPVFGARVSRHKGRGASHQLVIARNGNRWHPAGVALEDSAPRRHTAGDLFWDRVVAVEPDGEEDVFDLTVPGPACWLADGIVTHNSGQIEQDSDVVMFVYREDYYNAESERQGEADLILAKHRNGPIGKLALTFLPKYPRFATMYRERGVEQTAPLSGNGAG
jgi:replicative DNA helicase